LQKVLDKAQTNFYTETKQHMTLIGTTCDSVATGHSFSPARCDSVASGGGTAAFERRSLLEELAGKGVRLTSQRRALVEIIQEANEHLDAESLLSLARARVPHIDRATVYRTIEMLKRLRMIDELDLMHLNGEKHYYEVKTRREHVHLACFHCGRIEEFSSVLFEQLKNEIAKQAKFDVRVTRLEIGGRCEAFSGVNAVAE